MSTAYALVTQTNDKMDMLVKMFEQVKLDLFGFKCVMLSVCRAELQEYFHEIYFLPDLPELADASAVLKQYTDDPSR